MDTNSNIRIFSKPTPWDEKAFNVPTREFYITQEATEDHEHTSWDALTKYLDASGVQLSYGRLEAGLKSEILDIQNAGYQYVETSLAIQLSNVARWQPPMKLTTPLHLETPVIDDLLTLKKIACEDFHYGRFLEDPTISDELNQKRQANWVTDLFDKQSILVRRQNGKVIAFMAYSENLDTNSIDLILGGVASSHRMLVYKFWTSCLTHFKETGTKRINTMVSASNVGVVTLYAQLGFQFKTTYLGFRRWQIENP